MYDDLSLHLLYATAEVFVIHSRLDNLPNTGLDAHACGTPVLAFATGGLVEIVGAHTTGALAKIQALLYLASAPSAGGGCPAAGQPALGVFPYHWYLFPGLQKSL